MRMPTPAIGEAFDDLFQLRHGFQVDSREGLVQHEEFRLYRKGPGDFGSPPFAPGEGDGALFSLVRKAKVLQKEFQSFFFPLFREVFSGLQDRPDIVLNREFRKDRSLLRQVGNSRQGALIHG